MTKGTVPVRELPLIFNQNYPVDYPANKRRIYIGRRPGFEHYGNPFSHLDRSAAHVKVNTRNEAIQECRDWLKGETWGHVNREQRTWILSHLEDLWNAVMVCHCSPLPCHGLIYVEFLRGDHGPIEQYRRIR